jgi:hypothetical protein
MYNEVEIFIERRNCQMNSESDNLENNADPSVPSPGNKKDRVRRPLLPPWLAITLSVIALCTISLIVLIVRYSAKTIQEREITAEDVLFGPAIASASKLPEYDKSKFKTVIEAPGVYLLTKWRDVNGRDCIAAGTTSLGGFNSKSAFIVYDSSFNEIGRVERNLGMSFMQSKTLIVEDVTGDGIPEILVGEDGSPNSICLYDLSGNRISSITDGYTTFDSFFFIDSPSNAQKRVLCVSGQPYQGADYRVYDYSGQRLRNDEQMIASGIGGFSQPYRTPLFYDWDSDGRDDVFFPAYGGVGESESFTPYVKGKFQPSIDVPDTDSFSSPCIYRYTNANGKQVTLYASNSSIDKGNENSLSPIPSGGNEIFWKRLNDDVTKNKQYDDKSGTSFGESSLIVLDITGDGVPEICGSVCSKTFVVLDIEGNELLKEDYFTSQALYSQGIDYLISGDFDGDGFQDVAFACENGIFIPDLSTLRDSK